MIYAQKINSFQEYLNIYSNYEFANLTVNGSGRRSVDIVRVGAHDLESSTKTSHQQDLRVKKSVIHPR